MRAVGTAPFAGREVPGRKGLLRPILSVLEILRTRHRDRALALSAAIPTMAPVDGQVNTDHEWNLLKPHRREKP